MCSDKLPVPATIELGLTEEDLVDSLGYQKGLWLGSYTPEELFKDLEKYGVVEHIEARGYTKLNPDLKCEPFQSVLRITGRHAQAEEPQLLVEVKARRTTERLVSQLGNRDYSSLVLDWVLFQDPCAEFDEAHPQLPGQEHPGLHLLRLGSKLLMGQLEDLDVDLVIAYPRHFHNAVFYAPQFKFLEAETEGHFQALYRCLMSQKELPRASKALEVGEVADNAGRPVFWQQKAQAWAREESIAEHLFGETYQARVKKAAEQKFSYTDAAALRSA